MIHESDNRLADVKPVEEEPGFIVYGSVPARYPREPKPEPTAKEPPTPPSPDWKQAQSSRWFWQHGITEPVVKDGKFTGEYRVCRRPRGWDDFACSWRRDVPWEAVVDGFDDAKEWLEGHRIITAAVQFAPQITSACYRKWS